MFLLTFTDQTQIPHGMRASISMTWFLSRHTCLLSPPQPRVGIANLAVSCTNDDTLDQIPSATNHPLSPFAKETGLSNRLCSCVLLVVLYRRVGRAKMWMYLIHIDCSMVWILRHLLTVEKHKVNNHNNICRWLSMTLSSLLGQMLYKPYLLQPATSMT